MTEEEYLIRRIEEINDNLSKIMISKKQRANQNTALRFYQNQLERVKALKENDPPSFT